MLLNPIIILFMNPIYQFTIPVVTKSLKALDQILAKTSDFLQEKGMEESHLLNLQLAPDMFPFKKQVQIACDNAKGVAARLSGMEVPSHPDNEESIAELRTRIQKTLEILAGVTEASFKGAEARQVTLPYFPGKYLTGMDYAREYVLPNFFFHVTTAYALLRKEGMNIGKGDFLGDLPMKDLS